MDVKCTQCNANVPEGMAFCGQCGAPVRCICANYGAQNPAEFRFCGKCGNPIAVESPQALPPAETLAEAGPLQVSRSLIEGERRTVTVLFADAAGYTAMSERMDPEEVYRLMQGCFERMRQAVHQFEGSVNQYTGDGILALFGAPIAHEDSARRAVAAALEMQSQLESYANEVKAQYPIQCAYRIGLNTGPVVVGKISESLQLDFTAIGDTVNLASRIQTLAEPRTVCLSENTYRAAADFFECEDLGEKTVKGKAEPVHVYRAIRERSVQSRIEAAAARGLTEYVGRDRELQTLHSHLDEASRAHGQVVFTVGEAGVGKSRLLFEFRKSLANKSPRWVEGKCISFGKNVPNLPIIDLVKSTFGVRESDDNSHITQRIDEGVAQWEANAQAVAPYLKYLLNVDPGDPALATMTPMERRPGFVDALRTLVREESRQNPLVLVIEDLHWIDSESERMVNALADVVATAPVLMVLTSRPGYQHSLGERSYFHRVALSGLRPEDTASMAEKVLGATGLPEEIRELVLAKAEGNPFYVEEVSKALVETGVLVRQNGGYQVTSTITEDHVPETIQGVILARIDRLDPEARGAIQLASVIGREFSVRLLNRISDLEVKLDDALGELKALELIYETGYIPELSYMFKHALTHDVAYSTLLRERRQQLHRIVATAIETLYADRLPEHYEALAHHYTGAKDWEKALEYLEKSGDKARDAYANHEALEFYENALQTCEKVGADALTAAMRIADQRAEVQSVLGDFPAAIADYNRMRAYAVQAKDRRQEGMALVRRGYQEYLNHQWADAEKSCDEARAVGAAFAEVVDIAKATTGWMLACIGEHERVKNEFADLEAIIARIDDRRSFVTEAWILNYWQSRYDEALADLAKKAEGGGTASYLLLADWSEVLCLGSKGEMGKAISIAEGLVKKCERMEEFFIYIRLLNTVGWLYGEIEHHEESLYWNERCLTKSGTAAAPDMEVQINSRLNIADTLIALNRLDEAEPHLMFTENYCAQDAGEEECMMGRWNFTQHFFHSSGEFWLQRQEYARALDYARKCIELARSTDRPKNVVKGLRLQGEVLLAQDKPDRAEPHVVEAARIAADHGITIQEWKTLAVLGAVHEAGNKPDEATSAYRAAYAVIGKIADSLHRDDLKRSFLASPRVTHIRRKAVSPAPQPRQS